MTDRFGVGDRTAIVTGGSRGIGRAIAERFASEGAAVAICSRDADEIEAVADDLTADHPGHVVGVECDVRDRDAVDALVETTVDEFGGLDVFVANAGGSFMSGFDDLSANGWESVVDVNLTGTVACAQAASDHLKDGGGALVTMASVAGLNGAPYMSHYGAAKAAVVNLTRTLAYEWASDGVRVNCIAPGYVATPGVEAQMGVTAGDIDRESVDRNVGLPAEVADVAQFLASDAASFVTGETIAPRGVPDIEETPDV